MIPHSKPLVDEEELKIVIDIIKKGNIAVGPEIKLFENKMSKYIGKKYAVAVSNGTAAIHLALLALNIGKNDEIIIPGSVCPGVMHAIEYTGATPIICDTNKDDLNLSYASTVEHISKNTKAIILPHLFGIPSEIKKFLSLKIPIIEDCAQSLGAKYKNLQTGSYGDLSIFSFYATKMITSIDGGMILTDNLDIANKMRDLRYYAGKKTYEIRYNYKMQNINAGFGLIQLGKLDAFLEERKEIFIYLVDELSKVEGLNILTSRDKIKKSSNYKLLIKFTKEEIKQKYLLLCTELDISTGSAVFIDLHKFKYLKENKAMPNLYEHTEHTYSFPIYPGIDLIGLKDFVIKFKAMVG